MIRTSLWAICAIIFFCVGRISASAHDLAVGPNGGSFADTGNAHVEALIKGKKVIVYVGDEAENPIDAKKISGKVILLIDGQRAIVQLTPAPDLGTNVLSAELKQAPTTEPTAILSLNAAGKAISTRFDKLKLVKQAAVKKRQSMANHAGHGQHAAHAGHGAHCATHAKHKSIVATVQPVEGFSYGSAEKPVKGTLKLKYMATGSAIGPDEL